MTERRKIIIQTGANPDESLSTPHFDAEATQTARRVVPLVDQETYQGQYGHPAGRTAKPFWKHPALVVLVALVAIGLGVAAGFAIGIYRNRNTAETSTAPSPTPVDNADVGQTVLPSPPQASTSVPGGAERPSVEPEVEETRPTARNERKNDDKDVAPPVVLPDQEREPSDSDRIAEEREANRIERDQRREERRERRRRQREEGLDVPRQIERGGERIREIFEGRQP